MNLADLDFLTAPAGAQALADLDAADLSDAAILPLLTRLRRALPPNHAAALVEQAVLRRKAAAKFGPDAAHMLFTRDGLEQASDPFIRRYRAHQSRAFPTVIDACCGIGTDALEFAKIRSEDVQQERAVLGLDLDPVRIAVARHNAAALGLGAARFEVHDVTGPLPGPAGLVFFDPARRDAAGRRLGHVERYIPPLSTLARWDAPRIWAKLSPAVDLTELEAYPGTIEFHSVDGDLKEAVLKTGRDAPGGPRMAAVRHDAAGSAVWTVDGPEPNVALAEPRGWLIEPDPALLRAGLVRHLAARLGAAQLDPTIAYLTADQRPDTAWARAWRIVDWMPFNLKRLKAYLRQHGIGRITVKKRGHAMSPEQLAAALRLDGKGDERVVVLTRVDGRPAVVICALLGA